MTIARIIDIIEGSVGRAWKLEVFQFDRPDNEALLGVWFLQCPSQSPAWDRYLLSVIHLRDLPGVRPAFVRVPGATHEVLLCALNPERSPEPEDPTSWEHLVPVNVMEQVHLPDDAAAVKLVDDAALAVVQGRLWAEPPLSGQVEPWRTAMYRMAARLSEPPEPNVDAG